MSEVTCRGSFALGTACGKCSRCRREIESYNGMKAVRDKLNTPSSALSSIAKLEAENADLKDKLAKAVEALESVMVGGNHLATILPDSFPPAETEPLIALETMGYGYDFEVWCCWRSIMLARTTLAELTGGKDE